jgi:hypothetical protein
MRKCEIAKNAKDYIHDLVTLKNETPHDSNNVIDLHIWKIDIDLTIKNSNSKKR